MFAFLSTITAGAEACKNAFHADTVGSVDTGALPEKYRILVVDDDRAIRSVFALILEKAFPQVSVDTAEDGVCAVESFAQKHQQVVVMDLRMPRMDGLQAFDAIQALCAERGLHMPTILFCTGHSGTVEVGLIMKKGGPHALLVKPVDPEKMVLAIRNAAAWVA